MFKDQFISKDVESASGSVNRCWKVRSIEHKTDTGNILVRLNGYVDAAAMNAGKTVADSTKFLTIEGSQTSPTVDDLGLADDASACEVEFAAIMYALLNYDASPVKGGVLMNDNA